MSGFQDYKTTQDRLGGSDGVHWLVSVLWVCGLIAVAILIAHIIAVMAIGGEAVAEITGSVIYNLTN